MVRTTANKEEGIACATSSSSSFLFTFYMHPMQEVVPSAVRAAVRIDTII
jgi:hypothetical protein